MSTSPYHSAGKLMNQILLEKKSIKAVAFKKSKLTCNKATYATVCNTVQNKHNIDMILNDKGGKLRQAIEMDNARIPGMVYVLLSELLFGPYKSIRGGGKLKRLIMKQERLLKEAKATLVKSDDKRQMNIRVFPRYLRVNKLKASGEEIAKTLGDELAKRSNIKDIEKSIYVDPHVPDLVVLAPKTPLPWHELEMVKSGKVILQDKSSCFSALALVHGSHGDDNGAIHGDFIDACAAPGNKTSHLAALIYDQVKSLPSKKSKKAKVFCFDRSSARLSILESRMSQLAPLVSGEATTGTKTNFPVDICPTLQDFLKAEPSDKTFRNVKSILLDPSCSGSGIVNSPDRLGDVKEEDGNRIKSLSNFQLVALKHAMSFPNVNRIVYSTCSIHQRENEDVVAAALKETNESIEDESMRWMLVTPRILLHWKRRGFAHNDLTKEESDCLVRVNGLDGDDTNGFFVAYFERRGSGFGGIKPPSPMKVFEGVKGIYNGEFGSIVNSVQPCEKPEIKNTNKEKIVVAPLQPNELSETKEVKEVNKIVQKRKDVPKKAAKRLAWKRKQQEKKLERLKRQKAAKEEERNKKSTS